MHTQEELTDYQQVFNALLRRYEGSHWEIAVEAGKVVNNANNSSDLNIANCIEEELHN